MITKLTDKQRHFLREIQSIKMLEQMTTGLADFTEGDDEAELLAAGNCWNRYIPIDDIMQILAVDGYDKFQAKRLNSIAEYYRRHIIKVVV